MVGVRRRLCGWLGCGVGAAVLALPLAAAAPASAVGPPHIGEVWASEVTASSAKLSGEVDPEGSPTFARFEYIALAAFQANVSAGLDSFAGASLTPVPDRAVGAGSSDVLISSRASLAPETAYRYRIQAHSGLGTVFGPILAVVSQGFGGAGLVDGRGWEMVSPVEKNGGDVGGLRGSGVPPPQAAVGGGAVSYGSRASFAGAAGAPAVSRYLARREATSWGTRNLSPALLSGSYGLQSGDPFELLSADLSRGLLLNGAHCRSGAEGCAVQNAPLPGSGAPPGFQDYYLVDLGTGGAQALVTAADLAHTPLSASQFDLELAGADPALGRVLISTCAALTTQAAEVAGAEGCDPAAQNLYLWSGGGLSEVNVLPGQSQGTPGAAVAAPLGAIATGPARVFWTHAGDLYVWEGGGSHQVDAAAGGGGTFEAASGDGAVAYFSKAGHLWRYSTALDTAADLTPAGGVLGVLGAAADGSRVYYATASGIFSWQAGQTTLVAGGAVDASNYPPATGAARVSPDGTRLAFTSTAPLTGYDNTDINSGQPDSEVYLYADATGLACISCNPTGGRPTGPSSLPAAAALPGRLPYQPRTLVAGGLRLFFDSADAIALTDIDGAVDAYQWEEQGVGSCAKPGGCLALISSGTSGSAGFADASADGSDAFFLTDRSLVPADTGSVDLYDARVGGGFPVPSLPIPCEGDSCQPLPSPPEEVPVTTLVRGLGNPPVRYLKRHHHHHRQKAHRHRGHRHRHGGHARPPRSGAS